MKIAGVILAGGLARRMGGGDKALLLLGGEPLLARVIARLRPQVEEIVLNANGDPARFARFGLPVVPDTVKGFAGPLAAHCHGRHQRP
jgi:molybdopterin-guanine dinucleotide biosynthesis protein A